MRYFPFLISLCVLALLRLPTLFEPSYYLDEQLYIAIGQHMRDGYLLYRDVFDNKPPLIYALAALSPSVFWFRLLVSLIQVGGLWGLWAVSNKLLSPRIGVWAIVSSVYLFLMNTPYIEGSVINAEHLTTACALLSAGLLVNSGKRAWLLVVSGLCAALGLLSKIPAVFDVLFLLLLGLYIHKDRVRFLALFGAGFVSVGVITLLVFALQGTLADAFFAIITYNQSYIEAFAPPVFGGIVFSSPLRLLFLTFIVLLVWLAPVRLTARLILSWLFLMMYAVLLSNRVYPHYVQLLSPPLALLGGLFVVSGWRERVAAVMSLLALVGVLTVYGFWNYPVLPYYQNAWAYYREEIPYGTYRAFFDANASRWEETARYIKATTTTEDKVFIIGNTPQILAKADRRTLGPYVVLFQWQDEVRAEELGTLLRVHVPDVIVEIPDQSVDEDFARMFDTILGTYYKPETVIEGVRIWRRTHQPTALSL